MVKSVKISNIFIFLSIQQVRSFTSLRSASFVYQKCDLKIVSQLKSSKKFANKGNGDKSIPGSELFPAYGSSYVPLGMTPEEYAKIKKMDSDKLKKMDFGSWGPRFARSERPDGDWMVMPSLWTRGYETRKETANGSILRNTETQKSLPNEKNDNITYTMKRLVPIYLLAFLSIEMMATAAFFVMKKKLPLSLMAATTMQLIKRTSDIAHFTSILLSKLTILKLVLATILVKPIILGIDACYRKFLWSPRKTISMSTITLAGIVTISFIFGKMLTF